MIEPRAEGVEGIVHTHRKIARIGGIDLHADTTQDVPGLIQVQVGEECQPAVKPVVEAGAELEAVGLGQNVGVFVNVLIVAAQVAIDGGRGHGGRGMEAHAAIGEGHEIENAGGAHRGRRGLRGGGGAGADAAIAIGAGAIDGAIGQGDAARVEAEAGDVAGVVEIVVARKGRGAGQREGLAVPRRGERARAPQVGVGGVPAVGSHERIALE